MRRTVLALILMAVPTVVAADEIGDALKARQDHMKGYGDAMKVLAGMAKGETDYDAAAAQTAADKIAEQSVVDTTPWWVPGSSSEDLPGKSRALPALWTDGAKAGEIGKKLPPAAATLQDEAGKGRAEMGKALGGVGKVCQECHDSFQAEKQS